MAELGLHEVVDTPTEKLITGLIDAVNHLRHHGCLDIEMRKGSWGIYVEAVGREAMEEIRKGNHSKAEELAREYAGS